MAEARQLWRVQIQSQYTILPNKTQTDIQLEQKNALEILTFVRNEHSCLLFATRLNYLPAFAYHFDFGFVILGFEL